MLVIPAMVSCRYSEFYFCIAGSIYYMHSTIEFYYYSTIIMTLYYKNCRLIMTINFIVLLCYLHCFNAYYVALKLQCRGLLYHCFYSSAHYVEIQGSHDSRTMHACTCSYGNNHFMIR